MKREIPADMALRMLSNKPIALIGSRGPAGFNATVVSWLTPSLKNPPRLAVFLSPGHLGWENISETGVFTVNIPSVILLRETAWLGGVSGRKVPDKLQRAGVDAVRGKLVDAPLFPACIGHLECRVQNMERDSHCLTGEVVYALADETAFHDHWRLDTDSGRPLQHLGGEYWQSGADVLIQPRLRVWEEGPEH